MAGATIATDGRLGLMLTGLRLPTIKRLVPDLRAQSARARTGPVVLPFSAV